MVCLKAHDKSSNMRRTARQLLVNLHWLLIDLRIDLKTIFLKVFIKRIFCYLIETKTSIKTLSFGSLRNRVHICIPTTWIGRHDPPLQGLRCCRRLVKHFNISGSELVAGSTSIKSTVRTRFRVPRGKGVGNATVCDGIAVACSVVVYVKVVSVTKGWSPIRTCVNSVTVTT